MISSYDEDSKAVDCSIAPVESGSFDTIALEENSINSHKYDHSLQHSPGQSSLIGRIVKSGSGNSKRQKNRKLGLLTCITPFFTNKQMKRIDDYIAANSQHNKKKLVFMEDGFLYKQIDDKTLLDEKMSKELCACFRNKGYKICLMTIDPRMKVKDIGDGLNYAQGLIDFFFTPSEYRLASDRQTYKFDPSNSLETNIQKILEQSDHHEPENRPLFYNNTLALLVNTRARSFVSSEDVNYRYPDPATERKAIKKPKELMDYLLKDNSIELTEYKCDIF